MTGRYANGCASWRRNVVGSVTAAWATCWRERASPPTTRICCASTARKDCACGAVAAGSGRWARAGQWCCRMVRTSVGASSWALRALLRFASNPSLDSLICGRRFRILCVVDDYTRECLALVADTSLSGARVARELTSLMGSRGKPHTVVSDNGTELTSSAILRWSQERRVEWHYIAPGKPMQNGLAAPPWGRGKLQRSPARRMPQRDPVHLAGPCPVRPRRLAARLQYGQATLQAGREDPRRHRRPTCQTHIMKKRDSASDW
ncbi:MAG: hypothetical protein KatS3mg120_0372 [Erythrobacter sp.]|nr:MAG: hypothetical protein KatS3mg120_0372 [Erythrobacter sp.]